MSVPLLDVNVLIALFWPAHDLHDRARRWFLKNSGNRWATCSFTEAGFVRIVSNPRFSPQAVQPREAMQLLRSNLEGANHVFWPDNTSFLKMVASFEPRITGHQQVSDAYLLGLAKAHRGRLVTLDSAIVSLASGQVQVEWIG
jgi:uncharacterized protein